jgi:exosortase
MDYKAFVWYSALLALSFTSVVGGMVHQWQSDENMGHGLFVPLIAGYIAWERRSEWLQPAKVNNLWGLALIAWGALQLWVGLLGAEVFLQRTALLFSLAGLTLFFGSGKAVRPLVFPLLLLAFMVPIPGILYKQITFPLQIFSSRVAELVLEMTGFIVVREGNILELAGQQLSVVEACSGLRALHSLIFFSLTYAYLFEARPWVKWLLLGLTIPVAIVANSGRIVVTGVLGKYNQELATGIYHTVSGWLLFIISILLLIAAHKSAVWLVERRS